VCRNQLLFFYVKWSPNSHVFFQLTESCDVAACTTHSYNTDQARSYAFAMLMATWFLDILALKCLTSEIWRTFALVTWIGRMTKFIDLEIRQDFSTYLVVIKQLISYRETARVSGSLCQVSACNVHHQHTLLWHRIFR